MRLDEGDKLVAIVPVPKPRVTDRDKAAPSAPFNGAGPDNRPESGPGRVLSENCAPLKPPRETS